jgi:hypothetical protein
MGKNARIIALALAGLLAFAALQLWMARSKPVVAPPVADIDPYSKAALQPAADKLNLVLPKMVDEATRLDKAGAEDRLLTYHYTLTDISKDGFDAADYRAKQLATVAKTACFQYKQAFDNGVKMRYFYQDKAGLPLFDMELDAALCKAQLPQG